MKKVNVFVFTNLINPKHGDFDEIFKKRFEDFKKHWTEWPVLKDLYENDKTFNFSDLLCNDNIFLDKKFAKSLKIFDAIHPNLFIADTAKGKELIDFLSSFDDLVFIVVMREMRSIDHLEILFKIGLDDYYSDFGLLRGIKI